MSPTNLPRILVVDIETGSPCDIKKEGQFRYWDDPGTRVFMTGVGWLHGTDDVHVFDHEAAGERLPAWVEDALTDPSVMLAAANCEFDRAGLARMGYPTPSERWIDVLVCAYQLGFAGRLADVLSQTPLEVEKNPKGSLCISTFSSLKKAWHESPDLWDEFVRYCGNDVRVERDLLRWCMQWLTQGWRVPSVRKVLEQELIYREINRRGIPIDKQAVTGALEIIAQEQEELMETLRHKTGLPNPNSRDQMLGWVNQKMPYAPLPDLTKATVRDAVDDPETPVAVREVLELRQALNKSSVKKYAALNAATSDDGNLRGGWQFYGASRTGRVAGRTLNPANLPRPAIPYPEATAEWLRFGDKDLLEIMFPGSVLDTLSSCIRAMLKAPEGKLWCVADLSSIESVGAAWVAGCDTILDIFFAGRDTYKSFAAEAEGIDYEEVTKAQRTYYKPSVLGASYGLSGRGLVGYGAGMGVEIELEEAERQIRTFRTLYHEIPHYWKQLQSAAIAAIENPGREFHALAAKAVRGETEGRFGVTYREYDYHRHRCTTFRYDGTFLFMKLPSGRYLSYYRPEIEYGRVIHLPDKDPFTADSISYMGIDQNAPGNAWRRVDTRGPKFFENLVQGLCRDILWVGLKQANADPGLEVVGDCYDEIFSMCDETDTKALDRLIGYMTTLPDWLDDRFFLGASGYTSKRYRKD